MLGVSADAWGATAQRFNHRPLRDNVSLVDEATLKEINGLVAAAGRQVLQ